MADQAPLFDVKRLGPIVCRVCGATLQPDETKAPACTADRDRDQYPRRPSGCLNAINNAETEIPF